MKKLFKAIVWLIKDFFFDEQDYIVRAVLTGLILAFVFILLIFK